MNSRKRNPRVVYWLDNSLYLNITNRCSNYCYFCFRRFKNGIQDFNLKLEKEPTSEEVIEELQQVINRKNWKEVVFCGFGEPLERLDLVLEATKWIKKNHSKPVRVDTNGQGYLLNRGREVTNNMSTFLNKSFSYSICLRVTYEKPESSSTQSYTERLSSILPAKNEN